MLVGVKKNKQNGKGRGRTRARRENEEEEEGSDGFYVKKGGRGVFGMSFLGQKWIISYRKLP